MKYPLRSPKFFGSLCVHLPAAQKESPPWCTFAHGATLHRLLDIQGQDLPKNFQGGSLGFSAGSCLVLAMKNGKFIGFISWDLDIFQWDLVKYNRN